MISYNCQSLYTNLETVSSLLNDCDILLLQETLLTDNNDAIFENINIIFNVIQVPSVTKSNQLHGRSSGGLAILWEKMLRKM